MKKSNNTISKLSRQFQVGDACYVLYFGPRENQDPRWVPAIIVKHQGTRMFNVRVVLPGLTWRRFLDQLQLRYTSDEDRDPGEAPIFQDLQPDIACESSSNEQYATQPSSPDESTNADSPPLYTPQHPTRSS